MQNRSHAVMAQRTEAKDSPDDFPTPPWATRALIEHVLGDKDALRSQTCLEPACGAGHMARVLEEYFGRVRSSDAYDNGYGQVRDFLAHPVEWNSVDWVITNPLEERLHRSSRARDKAMLLQDLAAIRGRCARLPVLDRRRPDAIIGYDDCGLPADRADNAAIKD